MHAWEGNNSSLLAHRVPRWAVTSFQLRLSRTHEEAAPPLLGPIPIFLEKTEKLFFGSMRPCAPPGRLERPEEVTLAKRTQINQAITVVGPPCSSWCNHDDLARPRLRRHPLSGVYMSGAPLTRRLIDH